MEYLEEGLTFLVTYLKLLLEAIAIFCVIIGLFKTAKLVLRLRKRYRKNAFCKVRLEFGRWLVLALEFQLGADIVATTMSSTFDSLGQLMIIAIIRTFLNYFLMKELEAEQKPEFSKTM